MVWIHILRVWINYNVGIKLLDLRLQSYGEDSRVHFIQVSRQENQEIPDYFREHPGFELPF